jgi:hypothetical protein
MGWNIQAAGLATRYSRLLFCAAQLATTKQNKNFVFCFALSSPFTIFAESKSADE